MSAADLIRRLHQHRRWANQQLLESAASLNTDQLHRPFPIGQGSVWRTLTHLMAAEFVWLEALLGNETATMPGDDPTMLPGNQQGRTPIESLDELTSRWAELDARWGDYLAKLEDRDLHETVWKVSTSSLQGRRIGTLRGDVLLHLCTHAQYTTAQLVNMLRQLGHQPLPDVMLITMLRLGE